MPKASNKVQEMPRISADKAQGQSLSQLRAIEDKDREDSERAEKTRRLRSARLERELADKKK